MWRECFRVLKSGGILLSGFVNPLRFIFDEEMAEKGKLEVRDTIPYSDIQILSQGRHCRRLNESGALEFGHTLGDQIGGQLEAGFVLTGFYEDRCTEDEHDPISSFIDTFMAARAIKP